MSISTYLIVRASDGRAVNSVLWDGQTAYDPGVGLTMMAAPGGVGIGWTWTGEDWTPPEPEPEPEPEA